VGNSLITVYENNKVLFETKDIHEAAQLMAEYLHTKKDNCYDFIERGYVYNIPYYFDEEEYWFVVPKEVAAKRRKELEDIDHKNARRVWLMPANPNDYDVESAFSYYDTIDWKRSYNYENGDIIYIYVSGSVRRVRYKVEVIKGLVRTTDITYDNRFWKDEEKYEKSKEYDTARLRLLDEVDTPALSLAALRDYGLKGNIQGSMKLNGELRNYIMSFFNHDLTDGYFPEVVPEVLEEGKIKTINVNVYERNPFARKQCMDFYGVICQVCDLDFQDTYGEVGKDFIHVHHIIPLYKVQENYIVDPIKDLIPVCPNCHAMLHRKENGIYLSVEELRGRIKNKS
jgi:5-methylcytosine-specific restriction enzyme A